MKKLLKWIIYIIIAIVLLIALAVIIIVNFVNPNNYRDAINTAVSKQLQQPFAIHGDLNWTFFPLLGIEVHDVTVGDNAPKSDFYAKIDDANISLALLPLLNHRYELSSVKVNGLQLDITQKKDRNKTSVSNAPAPVQAGAATGDSVNYLAQLNLHELSIENANINITNAETAQKQSIKNFYLHAMNMAENTSFPLSLGFDWKNGKNLSLNIKLSCEATVDTENKKLSTENIKLNVEQSAPLLPIDFSFEGNIDYDLAKNSLNSKNFSGEFNKLTYQGDISGQNLAADPALKGKIKMSQTDLRDFLKKLGVDMPTTANPNALKSLTMTGNWQYQSNKLSVKPLNIQLDNNQITGQINSNDVTNMALSIDAATPQIAVSDYMKPAPDAKKIVLTNLRTHINFLPPIAKDAPFSAATIAGDINLDKISYDQLIVSAISGRIDAKNQVFNFSNLAAKLYGGTFNGNAALDLRDNQPAFSITPTFRNIQIKPLLDSLGTLTKIKISGSGNVSGNISARGSDANSIKRSLNGNLAIALHDGVLEGINIDYWISAASALFNKQALPPRSGGNETPFSVLTTNLQITNGLVSNRDLIIRTNKAQASGAGTANLVSEQLNYRINVATISDSGKAHKDVVPLIISGTFDNPSITPDMAAIAKAAIQNVVQNQVQKLTQNLSQNNPQLGNALQNLNVGKLFGG